MPIFKTGELMLGAWSFGKVNIEGAQADDRDYGVKISMVSSTSLELGTPAKFILSGSFQFKNGVVGISLNEAIDTGLITGTANKISLGYYANKTFKFSLEISELNKSIQEINDAVNTEDIIGIFSGNDEIYGNNFLNDGDALSINDGTDDIKDTDGAGNVFNGNHLHGYNGNDKIYGGKLIDSLWGDKGNDMLWGYGGNDFLYGGVGSDTLNGDDGNDKLNGGTGSDTLYGGKGNDALHGLSGLDKFVFDTSLSASTNLDTIKDFTKGTDKIVLDDDIFKAFTNKTSISLGQLKVVGTISNLSGDGYLTYVTANDTLYYDADGRGAGDIAFVKVELAGTAAPVFTDFQVIA
jgi:Ca2+-binding RTX toxin-like protein